MEKLGIPWSVPVAVDDIPETGLHLEIEPPDAARAALAELASVRDLPQISAVFDLTRLGAAVQVTGWVKARVGQTCVVTLEPIETTVDEAVDLKFVPGSANRGTAGAKAAPRRKQGDDDEPPEPLVDGTLDLGALATEFLILGIDPYPRKAGAAFAAPKVEDAGERPFAALEALKKRPAGN